MKISKNEVKCEVSENIHTPHKGKGNSEGLRRPKRRQVPGVGGGGGGECLLFGVFFQGASNKIGELLKTKSCSVKQTNSYFILFF